MQKKMTYAIKAHWQWSRRYLNLKKSSLNRLVRLNAKKTKNSPRFKFGERVPRSINEAYKINEETGTTGWAQAPAGYTYIKLLWAFVIKFDGRKRARLVAGGHMTETLDTEQTTSIMVSLDIIFMFFISAGLQDLTCLTGDINSAYIQAYT